MKAIILHQNIENGESQEFIVTDSLYNNLSEFTTIGGFKRFIIDVSHNNPPHNDESQKAIVWLSENVFFGVSPDDILKILSHKS